MREGAIQVGEFQKKGGGGGGVGGGGGGVGVGLGLIWVVCWFKKATFVYALEKQLVLSPAPFSTDDRGGSKKGKRRGSSWSDLWGFR